MHEIELRGIDGGSLLGFLAAVGTLRVVTKPPADSGVRMKWVLTDCWRPVLLHQEIETKAELLTVLSAMLCGGKTADAAWKIGNDLTLALDEFREQLRTVAAASRTENRGTSDFLAAFGSEIIGSGPKKEQMSDTEFRTMSGAGHQHFLGFMRELAETTETSHLDRTLFRKWDYADSRPSLRWDTADYRPHALRAEDPSGDPIRTMRGANRLAIEALPLFPTLPDGRRVRTTGFEDRNRVTEITWPIWSEPLGLDTVRSLLCSAEVQEADRHTMFARGVVQVFRAKRFTEGKYRNFSPARALL